MKKYIYISIGGFFGAILRSTIKNIQTTGLFATFPVTTLLINIIGSYILALLMTITFASHKWNPNVKLGVTVGFLGAFTTFSTLCKEVVELIWHADYSTVILYLLASITIGLLAAYSGTVTANKLFLRRK